MQIINTPELLRAIDPDFEWSQMPETYRVAYVHDKKNGTVIGFAVVTPEPDVSRIAHIAVRPGFRGRGFGSWLLDAVIQDHRGQMLVVSHPLKLTLNSFFGAHGFEPVGKSSGKIHRVRNPVVI